MAKARKRSEVENYEFKWGKEEVIDGQQKEKHYYESFSYNGTEFSLYDDVYLYEESAEKPYIGKILKIWEDSEMKLKIVKVLWFFQQDETQNWRKAGTSETKEIFLGSGVGRGLTNIRDLEAIAGKCNVVCTSQDSRNPQPSPEELERADFIFHRTFNVESRTISDKFPDKIADTDVRFLLNNERKQQFVGGSEVGVDNNEGKRSVIASKEVLPLRMKVQRQRKFLPIRLIPFHHFKSFSSLVIDNDSVSMTKAGSKKLKSSNYLGGLYVLSYWRITASGKAGSPCDEKTKSKPLRHPFGMEKNLCKKVRFDDKALAAHASEFTPKLQEVEVAKKPDMDPRDWFTPLPWEERLQEENKRGNLVIFDNLDLEFASKDVEDIVWDSFGEKCTAKVIPHTRISSPHSGRAFVIFEKRGAAERAVRRLDENCLMLPNRRPLVASWPNASTLASNKKPLSTFFGHLAIDPIKRQTAEQKKAVSTSHCSQPNTIEFDLAVEWCHQQLGFDLTWEELYKRHKREFQH